MSVSAVSVPSLFAVTPALVEHSIHKVSTSAYIRVTASGGEPLVDGTLYLRTCSICGPEVLQNYLLDEIPAVYRAQNVTIDDKHIGIIRQMLRKVEIIDPGELPVPARSNR